MDHGNQNLTPLLPTPLNSCVTWHPNTPLGVLQPPRHSPTPQQLHHKPTEHNHPKLLYGQYQESTFQTRFTCPLVGITWTNATGSHLYNNLTHTLPTGSHQGLIQPGTDQGPLLPKGDHSSSFCPPSNPIRPQPPGLGWPWKDRTQPPTRSTCPALPNVLNVQSSPNSYLQMLDGKDKHIRREKLLNSQEKYLLHTYKPLKQNEIDFKNNIESTAYILTLKEKLISQEAVMQSVPALQNISSASHTPTPTSQNNITATHSITPERVPRQYGDHI